MNAFTGGFFVVFSFFKLLNIRGLAEALRSYSPEGVHDAQAARFPTLVAPLNKADAIESEQAIGSP